jgi:hypothetical protein
MLLSPAVLVLLGTSVVVTLLLMVAAVFAIQVLRHWDIGSGSARQLRLERRTYLVSTFVALALGAELLALLLFVYNAEQLAPQLVGAMCATGVLNANGYGWPTLLLKLGVSFLAALWLVLNRLDNRGYDYPLVRAKYALLLLILVPVAAEAVAQWRFFADLRPDVITSCCGSLFSADADGIAAELSGIAPGPAMAVFYGVGLIAVASGGWLLRTGRGAPGLATVSALVFPVAIAGVISFLSLYVYEHPHHHCPFCLLQPEYGYIGYALYVPLLGATVLGLAAGMVAPMRRVPSLAEHVPEEVRRLARGALALHVVFYAVATYAVLSSGLILLGDAW